MAAVTHDSHGHHEAHGHHDHHDHGHHEESFVSKYIFSEDHKMIGKQFLITATFMGIVAMLLSILFRIQLAWPGERYGVWFLEHVIVLVLLSFFYNHVCVFVYRDRTSYGGMDSLSSTFSFTTINFW